MLKFNKRRFDMIFKNITLIDENMVPCENMFLATRDNKIEYIGREEPKKDYGRD